MVSEHAAAKKTHPADRLMAAIEATRSPVCVGIDPVLERMPEAEGQWSKWRESLAIAHFSGCLISAVSPYVPCVKVQSACFERYGDEGVLQLHVLIDRAKKEGVEVILDAKRGDIGVTAEHYAASAFEFARLGTRLRVSDALGINNAPDWLTINSYLGEDGITPFLKHQGHGAFALVRTSNPGGDAIQNLELKDGRTVSHAVAEIIADIGSKYVGERGYSSLGAVVGATKKQDAAKLREIMPQQMFLVPGYGAQGGGADDVLPCFKSDGTGAIVTASRSVIYAFDPKDPKWQESVGEAASKFADEIGRAVGMR